MMKKIKAFIRDNYIPFLFALLAVVIELTAVFVTSGKLFIRSPWMYFTVLGLLTALQFFLRTDRARHIWSSVLLSVLFVFDLVFIVIYEMTGTIFDFSMLNLRGDAMAILESVPINFLYTFLCGALLSAFVVFVRDFEDHGVRPAPSHLFRKVIASVMAVVMLCHVGLVYATAAKREEDKFLQDKIYEESAEGYAEQGVIGNLVSEMYEGAFSEVEVGSKQEIRDFIYSETSSSYTPYYAAAKDYNVVTILGETFEWFSFIADPEKYPNGHFLPEETLRQLYPNLYEFYDTSMVMTNFHAREKTDISENLSLFGSYPLDYYTNYDYEDNTIAYSLPNLMQTLYGVESKSFHNGNYTFYNRNEYLTRAVGFSEYIACEQMAERYGEVFTDYFDGAGERNMDSQMILACRDEMFPTDRRFNTYITTITMHGRYDRRDNLQPYYEQLEAVGFYEPDEEDEEAYAFYHYAAAAMDFDKALGIIMDTLRERDLLDNTLIVLFGDHNAYYQTLTNYVKDIYPKTDRDCDVTELYRVPMMIKIGSQTTERKEITKFTCTADILPTVMSLLGINYYTNLYYGTSVFDRRESVLYSRAYDVFLTDKLYFNTLDNIIYRTADVTDEYLDSVEQQCLTLMKKVSYINRIFASDMFGGKDGQTFADNMRAINGR